MQRGYTWLLVWLALGLSGMAVGQNLVPNGGFETYLNCPHQDNLLKEATPWYNPNRATPDFYHQCYQTGQMSLPPHSGQGIGRLFFDQGWAEYLGVRLKKPMIADNCYYFEMYIATETPGKYLTETLGAYFSTDSLTSSTTDLFPVRPQILDGRPKADVAFLQWQRVSGTLIAKGGEKYLTIGNFYRLPGFLGYYNLFFDDISVLPIAVDLGKDTTLCGRRSTLLLDATTPSAIDYRWSTGSTSPTYKVTSPGKYSVTVVTPCKILTDSIRVDYLLDFDLGKDTTLCNGQTLTLTVPPNLASTYRWQDGSSGNTFTVQQQGLYSVRVRQATCTTSDSIQVRYILPPTLDLGPDQDLCGAERFTIIPAVTEGTFSWQDQFPERNRTVTSHGVFRAMVHNACATVTDSIVIDYGACGCVLYTPDMFTPNADGQNDTFFAFGCGDITITGLSIFNRWGELLFRTESPPFQWDGTFQGQDCSIGVYAWHIEYRLSQRGRETVGQQQGSLTLVR